AARGLARIRGVRTEFVVARWKIGEPVLAMAVGLSCLALNPGGPALIHLTPEERHRRGRGQRVAVRVDASADHCGGRDAEFDCRRRPGRGAVRNRCDAWTGEL